MDEGLLKRAGVGEEVDDEHLAKVLFPTRRPFAVPHTDAGIRFLDAVQQWVDGDHDGAAISIEKLSNDLPVNALDAAVGLYIGLLMASNTDMSFIAGVRQTLEEALRSEV